MGSTLCFLILAKNSFSFYIQNHVSNPPPLIPIGPFSIQLETENSSDLPQPSEA